MPKIALSSLLILLSLPSLADLACDTTAHMRFDDNQNFLGADFEPCQVEILVPQIITIPGFSVDANGNVVTMTWNCPKTRVNGDPFDCGRDLKHYTVGYTGPDTDVSANTIETSYKTDPLQDGVYFFRVRAVDLDALESEWTDPLEVRI